MHTWPSISTETMELPLASVSDCEVRRVIQFLRTHGEEAAVIHCQITAVYGEECRMSQSMVCHWLRDFEGGRIKAAVVEYFQNLDPEYCRTGFQKLHKRYMKSLDLQGDYVQKWRISSRICQYFFLFFWTNTW